MGNKMKSTIDDMLAIAAESGAAYLKATVREADGGFRYMVAVVVDEETASDLDRLHDVYEETETPVSVMCAAADLLAALEELMEWEEEIAADLGMHTNARPILAKARAALAKARLDGEAPDA